MMSIRLTPAVKVLLIGSILLYVVQQATAHLLGDGLEWLALSPVGLVQGLRIWQLVTYTFLHGDVLHLLLNMLMLVFIGAELEGLWGTPRFLRFYFFCTTVAGLLYVALAYAISRETGILIGASAGIYGLLVAYGLIYGERVLLFMMLFPMKAKLFVWVLAGVEFLTLLSVGKGWLSSAAHLSGMASGFAYLWVRASIQIARRNRAGKGPKAPKRRKSGGHLKLIIDNDRIKGVETGDDLDKGPKTWH